jgi:RNA polymerase sigma-70 factor, ECF subfamily
MGLTLLNIKYILTSMEDLTTRINNTADALKKRFTDRNLLNLPEDTQVNDFAADVLEYTERFIARKLQRKQNHIKQQADDIAQTCTTVALDKFDQFNQSGHFTAWLNTICTTRAINALTRNRYTLNLDDENPAALHQPRWTSVSTQPPQPVDTLVDKEDADRLHRAINDLSPIFRTAVEKVHLNGDPYEDAASSEGVPIGTIKRRLHTARGRLQERLEDSDNPSLTR